jgi:hypothetical protein
VNQHSKQEVNWEFLLASSKSTLQAYEMSRLNFAANVRKEIVQLLDTWVSENSNALLARWLIERNLAAEAEAICESAAAGLSELKDQRTQLPCTLHDRPKHPSRTAPRVGSAMCNASDKIFGEKPFTTPRTHATS